MSELVYILLFFNSESSFFFVLDFQNENKEGLESIMINGVI